MTIEPGIPQRAAARLVSYEHGPAAASSRIAEASRQVIDRDRIRPRKASCRTSVALSRSAEPEHALPPSFPQQAMREPSESIAGRLDSSMRPGFASSAHRAASFQSSLHV
jgi:hypothetical protein